MHLFCCILLNSTSDRAQRSWEDLLQQCSELRQLWVSNKDTYSYPWCTCLQTQSLCILCYNTFLSHVSTNCDIWNRLIQCEIRFCFQCIADLRNINMLPGFLPSEYCTHCLLSPDAYLTWHEHSGHLTWGVLATSGISVVTGGAPSSAVQDKQDCSTGAQHSQVLK